MRVASLKTDKFRKRQFFAERLPSGNGDDLRKWRNHIFLRLLTVLMRMGELVGKNKEKWGDMSSIKRGSNEKILSGTHFFEALAQWRAAVMVKAWNASFQYANTPVSRPLIALIRVDLSALFTTIDTFAGIVWIHRGERREKHIVGWRQTSLFELRPDKPPEKLKEYLGPAP